MKEYRNWTEADTGWLLQHSGHLTRAQLSDHLDREWESVYKHLVHLQRKGYAVEFPPRPVPSPKGEPKRTRRREAPTTRRCEGCQLHGDTCIYHLENEVGLCKKYYRYTKAVWPEPKPFGRL